MNLSAKTEYACLAVLELATHYERDEPLRVRQIADAHGIPSRFLVQILLQLKGAGFVSSTRGAAGGYRLLRDPSQLTLADVIGVIEGRPGEVNSNTSRETPTARVLLEAWQRAAQAQLEVWQSMTFADLVERVRNEAPDMYYI